MGRFYDNEKASLSERRQLIQRLPKGRYLLVYEDNDVYLYRVRPPRAVINQAPMEHNEPLASVEQLKPRFVTREEDAYCTRTLSDDFREWKRNRERNRL